MKSVIHPVACGLIVSLGGCASRQSHQAEVATAHQAGVEAAFEMLHQSGIAVVRMEGPFLRPVILWHDGLTLAQALIEAGYQPPAAPTSIFLQLGREIETVDSSRLLAGEDLAIAPGSVIHARP